MANDEKPRLAIPPYEHEQISRGLLAWINQYPEFPPDVKRFNFEFLWWRFKFIVSIYYGVSWATIKG